MNFELGVSHTLVLPNFRLQSSFTCKKISYLFISIWNYIVFLDYEIGLPQKSELFSINMICS